MTHAPEDDKTASPVAASSEWVRPIVRQLAAGRAEDGSGPALDGILNPS